MPDFETYQGHCGPVTYRLITAAADVTDDLLAIAEETYAAWFDNGEPIDWDEFWSRMVDPDDLYDRGIGFDFPNLDSPAQRKIQRHIRKYRSRV